MSQARHQNLSFRSKKLSFRELDSPFETAPITTRDSTSAKNRCAPIPSRVTRLRRLIKLSSSRRLMCLPLKKKTVCKHHDPIQLQSKWYDSCTSIVHVARWFFEFSIEAHVFSLLFGQIVQGEPCLLCGGCNAATNSTRRRIRSIEFCTWFRTQFRLQQRSKPRDKAKARRAERRSLGKARANAHLPQDALQERPIQHERNSAFKRESKCA